MIQVKDRIRSAAGSAGCPGIPAERLPRSAAAVDKERRGRLTRAGLDYLRLLKNPPVKVRFDIVEVLLRDGAVREVRHLANAFAMERPYRYG